MSKKVDMKANKGKEKITVKQIFMEHWGQFREKSWHGIPIDMQKSVEESVTKMLGCGDPKNGYTKYVCTECGEEKVVGFTCKSRFCNPCGKVYIENWVNKQVENIIETPHRHAVFTVPAEIRGKIYWNKRLIKDMSDRVAGLIERWYKQRNKSLDYRVGIITVVHTFGRDLKFNPHIHVLVTEGALDKYNVWKSVGYIPYEYLRKAWQKVLLDLIKEKFGHDTKIRNLINILYHRYPKGFYVHAGTRMRDARGAAQYIGRYLARPAIAEYRIIKYDGQNVRFWYEDHNTGKRVEVELSAVEFIGKLVMHIPPKYFKMVRRYGLYQRNKNNQAQKIVSLWNYIKTKNLKKTNKTKSKKLSWKERIRKEFGDNPIACPKCRNEMELWTIWHPKYGYIYEFLKDGPEVKENEQEGKRRNRLVRQGTIRRRETGGILQLSLQAV